MDIAYGQNTRIASLNSALLDTVVWDPRTCPFPSSCSTPHQTRTPTDAIAPDLPLSNRFSVLTVDSPALVAALDSNADFPPLQRDVPKHQKSSAKTSARRRILKEAVRRRTSGTVNPAPAQSRSPSLQHRAHLSASPPVVLRPEQAAAHPAAPRSPVVPRSQSTEAQSVSPRPQAEQRPQQAAATSVQLADNAPLQLGSTAEGLIADGSTHTVPVQVTSASSPQPSSSHAVPLSSNPQPPPQPLFPPTTIIVGDSIIRHVHFFNAKTHCFPGATVSKIVQELPSLLQSMPPTIHRAVIHVGTNDMSQARSELTKRDFKELFNVLKPWIINGLSVFVSGPLPALYRGDERFSRTRLLNTWLNSTCRSHHIHFIDNFNLFWNRPSHFKPDGLHLNRFGSRILSDNFQYTISNSTPAPN